MIVAQMLAKEDIAVRGVMPPEVCVHPQAFFEELAKRNIEVCETIKKTMS